MQLTAWFTVIGVSALLGVATDFVLGKSGQQKVRDWLELRWYRTHDVAMHNFGKREAEAYLAFFDTYIGIVQYSARAG